VIEDRKNINILFYDGDCGLCHWWVKFILRRDKLSKIYFTPLQGEVTSRYLSKHIVSNLPDSIVFLDSSKKIFVKYVAVKRIFEELGWAWSFLASVLNILPLTFMNLAYDWVARNRRRFFRKPSSTCPLVSDKDRSRFIL
jgi:predicted DCC family thiol-disulfide oxidoreductase YuxK